MQKLITVNFAAAPVQRKLFEGREHLVVPVVAIKAGVLNGELVSAEEIGRFAHAWNRTPITIHHPQVNGTHVSANGESHREQSIGYLFDVQFINDSLKGNLWLDIAKAQRLGGDALAVLTALEQGTLTEVSTGYFCKVDPAPGTFNGKPYTGIQHHIVPDHLALLPGAIGACSVVDGCGAPRVNKDIPMTFVQKLKAKLFGNLEQALADIEAEEPLELPVSTSGRAQVHNNVVYTGTLLKEKGITLGLPASTPTPVLTDNTLYLPAGTYTDAEVAPLLRTLVSSAVQAPQGEPAISPPSPAINTHCDCSVTAQHEAQEVPMDKIELVSNVLRVQKRPESERALYEALPEEVLKALAAEQPQPMPPAEPPVAPEPPPPPPPAPAPQVNADALYAFKQFEALAQQRRDKLTAQIVANTDFTAGQLARKDLAELEQLARNIVPQANYSGRAFPQQSATPGNNEPVYVNGRRMGVPPIPSFLPETKPAA